MEYRWYTRGEEMEYRQLDTDNRPTQVPLLETYTGPIATP